MWPSQRAAVDAVLEDEYSRNPRVATSRVAVMTQVDKSMMYMPCGGVDVITYGRVLPDHEAHVPAFKLRLYRAWPVLVFC